MEGRARLDRLRDAFLTLLLLATVLVAYAPAGRGGRLLDDDLHITRAQLRSWAGLGRIWFEPGATQQYYPVVHTAFWVEHRLWGDDLAGYHLVNVLLHALDAVLVVPLMRRLRLPGAWLGAFVFALHPVCVESVAWIAEQKNTLSTAFCLLAALAYLRWDDERAGRTGALSARRYWAGTGLFALALLSKTAVAPAPLALLAIAWWRRGELCWRRDISSLLPWFALSAGVGLATLAVERHLIATVGTVVSFSLLGRLLLAGRAFWFYLGKLAWPFGLTFFYPRWRIDPASAGQYLPLLAALALAIVLARAARRRRGPMAACLCFAAFLLPVLGFFNVEWFVFSYVADHLQYQASLAVIIAFSAALAAATARLPVAGRWLRPAGAGALALGLGLLTFRQCGRYADPFTFYRTAFTENPQAAPAYDKLGTLLADSGHLPEAMAAFDRALAIRPDLPGGNYNRGSAYLRMGRLPEAIAELQRARQLQPDSPDVLTNLGVAFARSGRLPEAIESFEAALRIEPGAGDARGDLVRAHYQQAYAFAAGGRVREAAAELSEVVRLEPDLVDARVNLGALLLRQGRTAEAVAQLEAAVQLRPDDARLRSLLQAARGGN